MFCIAAIAPAACEAEFTECITHIAAQLYLSPCIYIPSQTITEKCRRGRVPAALEAYVLASALAPVLAEVGDAIALIGLRHV